MSSDASPDRLRSLVEAEVVELEALQADGNLTREGKHGLLTLRVLLDRARLPVASSRATPHPDAFNALRAKVYTALEALCREAERPWVEACATLGQTYRGSEIEAEEMLADVGQYREVYAAESTPCPVVDCPLSAQEHHRLAYGWLTELRELRKDTRQ